MNLIDAFSRVLETRAAAARAAQAQRRAEAQARYLAILILPPSQGVACADELADVAAVLDFTPLKVSRDIEHVGEMVRVLECLAESLAQAAGDDFQDWRIPQIKASEFRLKQLASDHGELLAQVQRSMPRVMEQITAQRALRSAKAQRKRREGPAPFAGTPHATHGTFAGRFQGKAVPIGVPLDNAGNPTDWDTEEKERLARFAAGQS